MESIHFKVSPPPIKCNKEYLPVIEPKTNLHPNGKSSRIWRRGLKSAVGSVFTSTKHYNIWLAALEQLNRHHICGGEKICGLKCHQRAPSRFSNSVYAFLSRLGCAFKVPQGKKIPVIRIPVIKYLEKLTRSN